MHLQRILQMSLGAVMFVLLVAASATAQYGNRNGDEGQYQILEARYGTARETWT